MLTTLTIPLQLLVQLSVPGNSSYENATYAIDTPLPKQPTGLPDGYTAFRDIGMAYKFFNYKRPWNSARKLCIEEGGNLVVIDSFKKIEHLMSVKSKDSDPHVGIHRLYDYDEWTSVRTGLPLTAQLPWAPEPNVNHTEWLCMAIWFDGRGIGADDCNKLRNFVCEIPLPID